MGKVARVARVAIHSHTSVPVVEFCDFDFWNSVSATPQNHLRGGMKRARGRGVGVVECNNVATRCGI